MPRLSENAISFFGAGGHKHDGVSSTLISTDKYSLFDFNPGYRGSQSRITIQQANQSALEEWVMNLVNTKVLAPAGLDLAPGLLSGKSIRANTITATELQANTITADEIAANAVTANELAANLVLVNNVIRSNNYNGTIAANGAITANGNAGWAITSFGSAEFANAVIRGNVTANAGSIGGWNVDSDSLYSGTKSSNGNYATSGITIGSSGFISAKEFRLDADGNAYFKGDLNGANIVGVTGRFTGSVTVNGDLTAGATTIYANGQITNGGYNLSAAGALTATGANINGTVTTGNLTATGGKIGDWFIDGSNLRSTSATLYGQSQFISLDPDGGIYSANYVGGSWGSGYYTEVKINYGSLGNGIDVTGNADNGTVRTTEIRSSYINSYYVTATGQLRADGTLAVGSYENESANTTTGAAGVYASPQGFLTISRPSLCLVLNETSANAASSQQVASFRRKGAQPGSSGIYVSSGAVVYSTSSDYRLKKNVVPIPEGINLVNRLNPVSFDWIAHDKPNKTYGFLAHELAEVVPDAVMNEKDGIDEDGNPKYQSVDLSFTVPIIVSALKESIAKIEELEVRIQALEGVQ